MVRLDLAHFQAKYIEALDWHFEQPYRPDSLGFWEVLRIQASLEVAEATVMLGLPSMRVNRAARSEPEWAPMAGEVLIRACPPRHIGEAFFQAHQLRADLLDGRSQVRQRVGDRANLLPRIDVVGPITHLGAGIGSDAHQARVAQQSHGGEGGIDGHVVLRRELSIGREGGAYGELARFNPRL
jgi:hypothetical protein